MKVGDALPMATWRMPALPSADELRARFTAWRKRRGFSQEEACKLVWAYAGVRYHRSSLSQFEAGKHGGIEYDTARALIITMEKA